MMLSPDLARIRNKYILKRLDPHTKEMKITDTVIMSLFMDRTIVRNAVSSSNICTVNS